MSKKFNQLSKKQRLLASLSLGFLLLALASLPAVLTQAQSKQAEKKIAVKDMFTRESKGSLRANPGFEFIKNGPNAIAIRSLNKKTVHAIGGCSGECTKGVKCAAETNGLRATCCSGDNPVGDCIIDLAEQ